MFGRPDPFFGTRTPHTNSFLESMHRTYGEPQGALPRRDEEAFKRAVQFRQKEKQRYAQLDNENKTLKSKVMQLEASRKQLMNETGRIQTLWEELSKEKAKKHDSNLAPSDHSSSAGPASTKPDVAAKDSGVSAEEDDVRREVLPAELPDPRGQASEHAAEGPERGGGSGDASAGGEPSDAVPGDES